MSLHVQDSGKTELGLRSSVREQLRVKNSNKIRREVHSSVTAGARQ